MTPDITSVKALDHFWIKAEFADGQVRRFDMQSYLAYPAFAPLKECGLFKRAHVAHGVVV